MRWADVLGLSLESLGGHRLRTVLSGIAVGIGATSVLLLTSLGDAAKGYVTGQFSALGTNLVTVSRGLTRTTGGMPLGLAGTRDLTLGDCDAIRLRVPQVAEVAPMSMTTAAVAYGARERDVYVFGVTEPFRRVRSLSVAAGEFLPPGEIGRNQPVLVLGDRLRRELFGSENPVGRTVRVSEARFRVIGALAPKGRSFVYDYDDAAFVPVGAAMSLFDQSGVYRIALQARDAASVPAVIAGTRAVLIDRHREEDFTLTTPDAMITSFRSILDALTIGLAGIAAISLAVAGIGIMNVMLVAVSERVAEVGLLKALGARPSQITRLFLSEALLLSAAGAILGMLAGLGLVALARRLFPVLPLSPSPAWMAAILVLALVTGGVFGLGPARRAARLPAAEALQGRR